MSMNKTRCFLLKLSSVVLVTLAGLSAPGQTFQYQVNDLFLTFRKTGINQENYESLVNIGQASNYVGAAIGAKLTVKGYAGTQVTPGSFTSLNNISWSVIGYYVGTAYPGYPSYTLWVTVPRQNNSIKTADAARLDRLTQNTIRSKIASIASNAGYVSQDLGTSNQFNTVSFVRESIAAYPGHTVSVWMGGTVDNTIGTLNDTWPATEPNGGNLELTTSSRFGSAVRSDLYEVRPLTDAQGQPIVDPHTGTSGLAYYVGYFEYNPDGTLTFTREAPTSQPINPPAPQLLSTTYSGNTTTIWFSTTNGATYMLFYTTATGLGTPISAWTALPTTLLGTGNPGSLSDTSSDSERFYIVGAHF